MKHRHHNRILGRGASHRRQLMQNLTRSLLKHGSIITTEAKAKELRLFAEPLITAAKQEPTLLSRRRLLQKSGGGKEAVAQLQKVGRASAARAGGYLRLTKLPVTREDGARTIRVEIIDQV